MNDCDTRSAAVPRSSDYCRSPLPAFSSGTSDDRYARISAARWFLRCSSLALTMLIACGFAYAEQTTATPASVAGARDPIAAFVSEAAHRFDIPEQWIRAVMQLESAGDVRAVSPKGAMGLMQIMPETWARLRVRYSLGTDPFDPHDNIIAGAAYLRELHDQYGDRGFLAAYNAGPVRYEDHLTTGRPLPVETQNYVAILMPMMAGAQANHAIVVADSARSWTSAPLFTAQISSTGTTLRPPVSVQVNEQLNATVTSDWTALAPQSEGLFVAISAGISRP